LGLAMDAFAVSVAAGIQITALNSRHVARLALSFGFFQFFMPVVGWLAGRSLSKWLEAVDHWVAFGLLVLIGGKMLWESFRPPECPRKDPTRGWTLVILSIATSIDALAVGLSFAFLSMSIVVPVLIIGTVAFIVTGIGFLVGRKAGRVLGERAETVGGIILLAIGLRILLSHLL